MKYCIKLIIFTILTNISLASAKPIFYTDSSNLYKRSAFYFEILGNGLSLLSVNYEYSAKISNNLNINSRIGYGLKIEPFTDFYTLPIEVIFMYSKNKKHYVEMSLGLTGTKTTTYRKTINYPKYITYYFARLGYRYQSKGGFLFRIGATPFGMFYPLSGPNISQDPPIALIGGISFGYSFQSKK